MNKFLIAICCLLGSTLSIVQGYQEDPDYCSMTVQDVGYPQPPICVEPAVLSFPCINSCYTAFETKINSILSTACENVRYVENWHNSVLDQIQAKYIECAMGCLDEACLEACEARAANGIANATADYESVLAAIHENTQTLIEKAQQECTNCLSNCCITIDKTASGNITASLYSNAMIIAPIQLPGLGIPNPYCGLDVPDVTGYPTVSCPADTTALASCQIACYSSYQAAWLMAHDKACTEYGKAISRYERRVAIIGNELQDCLFAATTQQQADDCYAVANIKIHEAHENLKATKADVELELAMDIETAKQNCINCLLMCCTPD